MTGELKPGTMVRLKSGTEGWVKGQIAEYFDIVPSVGGVIYTGPGYKVYVLEGKHKGETIKLPANYIEELKEGLGEAKAEGLHWHTIRELKNMCRDRGLSIEGTKESLIRRLK